MSWGGGRRGASWPPPPSTKPCSSRPPLLSFKHLCSLQTPPCQAWTTTRVAPGSEKSPQLLGRGQPRQLPGAWPGGPFSAHDSIPATCRALQQVGQKGRPRSGVPSAATGPQRCPPLWASLARVASLPVPRCSAVLRVPLPFTSLSPSPPLRLLSGIHLLQGGLQDSGRVGPHCVWLGQADRPTFRAMNSGFLGLRQTFWTITAEPALASDAHRGGNHPEGARGKGQGRSGY